MWATCLARVHFVVETRMTTLELFFYIMLGVLLQVALFSIVAVLRHFRSYRFLQSRMAGLDVEPTAEPVLQDVKDMLPDALTGKTPPWKGLRNFTVARKVFEDPAELVCSFYLKPTDGGPLPDYKPGQFLTFQLTVRDPMTDGPKNIVRCYSLSDAPGNEYYRVSIKRALAPPNNPDAPPGLSSNHFHDNVNEGDVLAVKPPSGQFFMEPGNSPVVLIAGGIGITPMLSMLNTTIKRESNREVWLFYGVRNSFDHAMKAHFEVLASVHANFHLHVCYSDPLAEDKLGTDYQHAGFVDIALLRQTLSFQIHDFYICGPRPMMEALVPALEEWGVPDQHIHYESFGPASITRSSRKATTTPDHAGEPVEAQGPVNVTFAKSGKTIAWDGSDDTLLDFAEKHGIDVDSGCRAGGCGSCQTRIKSGEVAYIQAPDYEVDEGSCLMCVSRPKNDLTVEA